MGRFLQDKGSHILATNYRSSYEESDIMTLDGKELVFVKMRTRRGGKFSAPEESLSKSKVNRLVNTCQDYVQNTDSENIDWHVDLVCICLGPDREVRRIHHPQYAVQL